MAYPDNLVQEGETVALDLRPHWWYFSRNILTGIPLAIVLIVVLSSDTDWISKYGGILVGIVAIAWAVWLGLKYLQWRMTYFVVTSRRVLLLSPNMQFPKFSSPKPPKKDTVCLLALSLNCRITVKLHVSRIEFASL